MIEHEKELGPCGRCGHPSKGHGHHPADWHVWQRGLKAKPLTESEETAFANWRRAIRPEREARP